MGDRQLSLREWTDAAYALLVESLHGPNESIYKAIERANDMFLTERELARKQNAEAFRRLKIPRPGVRNTGKVVPFA